MTELEYQTCRICKEDKPISEYHKNSGYVSGFLTLCKECVKKRRKGEIDFEDRSYHNNNFVREEVNGIFTRMGYDLNEPIYPQFKRLMESKGIDTSNW